MQETTVLMMIDGLDPEYLDAWPTPNLQQLAADGFRTQATAVMPTVTNVNNVSLVTGSYPEVHGITSNFWMDREAGREVYMESGDYIQGETIFRKAERRGARSLLVTAKDKLRSLLGVGATISVSSEQPPEWVVQGVGPPPPIYSLEVNRWVIDAARFILSKEECDLAYVTTTDYAMHMYSPEEPESGRHLELLDEGIGRLVDEIAGSRVLITADHGMSSKRRMIDLPRVLAPHGIQAEAVPIIKDRYTVHHSNLGGCIYLYLPGDYLSGDCLSRDLVDQALEVLSRTEGVDEALSRADAADRFHLMPERIGDIMVLGAPDVVFGNPAEVEMPQTLRSHGSLHEASVPIIGYGGQFEGHQFKENIDLGRYVLERVLV